MIWGYECCPCTRTVDNHIFRLDKNWKTIQLIRLI